jgi:predicted short-subunit dehydrogenase-like oxidoreductase (DUF2520 family)
MRSGTCACRECRQHGDAATLAVTQTALSLGVLGLGRVGTCLSRALRLAGQPLKAVASANYDAALQFAAQLGEDVRATTPENLAAHATLIFITVPDANVARACALLGLPATHAAIHTSGALGLDALSPQSGKPARRGVFHPLQAFPRGAAPERFHGVHVGIEADDSELEQRLEELARALGSQVFSLRGVERAAYHAAAVFASNYVVALHAAAARIWTSAGLPHSTARVALAPLTLGAASAIAEHELPTALTGPLVRGDLATLERHLAALESDSELAALYRALARQLLSLPLALEAAPRSAASQLMAEVAIAPREGTCE